MFQRNLQTNAIVRFIILTLLCLVMANSRAADDEDSSFGLTSFAFASYLGTGFYTTSGQNVFVLQLPFKHVIKELNEAESESGLVLKLPITVGFINFDSIVIDQLPEIEDVGTVTFLPGIEYQYPVTANWTLKPFVDYGFARELNATNNVLIVGAGVKSYFNVDMENAMFTLGNRLLYARERSKASSNDLDYSLIETGLNYRSFSDFTFSNGALHTNLYYILFYYPNDLVFFEKTPNPIRVGVEHEVGFTISNIPDFLFFEKPQIGIGVRVGNNVSVYRLVFGAPF